MHLLGRSDCNSAEPGKLPRGGLVSPSAVFPQVLQRCGNCTVLNAALAAEDTTLAQNDFFRSLLGVPSNGGPGNGRLRNRALQK
jgi:hypothetical protein